MKSLKEMEDTIVNEKSLLWTMLPVWIVLFINIIAIIRIGTMMHEIRDDIRLCAVEIHQLKVTTGLSK